MPCEKADENVRKDEEKNCFSEFSQFFVFSVFHYLIFLALPFTQNIVAQYRFDSFTTDKGLPQNGVSAITQTPDGYLWFTTFDGLVRYYGAKAFSAYQEHLPDWVLMDVEMPEKDGLAATREICTAFSDAKIVIVTKHSDAAIGEAAHQVGAFECVVKENLLELRGIISGQEEWTPDLK